MVTFLSIVLVIASLYLPQGIAGALGKLRRKPPPQRPAPQTKPALGDTP